jgi:hypothetical protein
MPRKPSHPLGHQAGTNGRDLTTKGGPQAEGLTNRGELSDLTLEQVAAGLLRPPRPI